MENIQLNRRSDDVLGRLPAFPFYLGRLAVISVPFFSLYKPARMCVSALTCSLQIIEITQNNDQTSVQKGLEIAKKVMFLFCVIYCPKGAFLLAMIAQTYEDIKDRNAYAIFSRKVYIISLWNRDPRWVVAALALEIGKDGREAYDEAHKGRWLEAGGKLFMVALRTYQTNEEISRVRRRFFGKEVKQTDWDEIVKAKDVEKSLKEKNFSDVVKDVKIIPMQKKELYDVTLKNIVFERGDFSGSELRDSSIENVTFRDCNMEDTYLERVKLVHVIWERSNLSKGTFFLCKGMDTYFVACDLTRFCLSECHMERLEIFASKLFGASFYCNYLTSATLKSCDLTDVLLTNATFNRVDCTEHRITQPVVALPWNFSDGGSWGKPLPEALEDHGMLTLKFSMCPDSVDPKILEREVVEKLKGYPLQGEKSRPQMLLDDPLHTPALETLKWRARHVMTYADGVLLSGGEDVEPSFYQDGNERGDFRRSVLEFAVIHTGKPVMGICRGSQVINVYFGGTLKNVTGQMFNQELVFTKGRLEEALREKIGGPVIGFSSHHQAVDRLGKGLNVILERDGVVKATIHENGRVLGTQFHPEMYVNESREFFYKLNKIHLYALSLKSKIWHKINNCKKPIQKILSRETDLSELQKVIRSINSWIPLKNNRIFFKIFFQMVNRGGSTLRRLRFSLGGSPL